MGKVMIEHPGYYLKEQDYGTAKPMDLRNNKETIVYLIPKPLPGTMGFILEC
jgi:hypothetical protein